MDSRRGFIEIFIHAGYRIYIQRKQRLSIVHTWRALAKPGASPPALVLLAAVGTVVGLAVDVMAAVLQRRNAIDSEYK